MPSVAPESFFKKTHPLYVVAILRVLDPGILKIKLKIFIYQGDDNSKKTSVWTAERLVCNYGPGGNEIGKPVYKRGVSCQDCPNGTVCSVGIPGLCAIQGN